MKKNCKECPYKVKSEHNQKFPDYVDRMLKAGVIKSNTHTCHMKGNVWQEPTDKTVCVGSLSRNS